MATRIKNTPFLCSSSTVVRYVDSDSLRPVRVPGGHCDLNTFAPSIYSTGFGPSLRSPRLTEFRPGVGSALESFCILPASPPHTIQHLWVFFLKTSAHVLYVLLAPWAFYVPTSTPTPFASLDAGAPMKCCATYMCKQPRLCGIMPSECLPVLTTAFYPIRPPLTPFGPEGQPHPPSPLSIRPLWVLSGGSSPWPRAVRW